LVAIEEEPTLKKVKTLDIGEGEFDGPPQLNPLCIPLVRFFSNTNE
jgi:hypothetical protein